MTPGESASLGNADRVADDIHNMLDHGYRRDGETSGGAPSGGMHVYVRETSAPDKSTILRVELSGEMDLNTAGQLEDTLAAWGSSSGLVVIDLNGLSFIGSAGLRALLTCQQSVAAAGGNFVLLAAASHRVVRRPLELTGLDKLLTIIAAGDGFDGNRSPM